MTDITWIVELAFIVVMFILTKKVVGVDKTKKIIEIVEAVVAATNELAITGELVKYGKSKADYAMEQTKTLLAKNKITFNEDELLVFIKSAVTRLRIEVSGTDAEKTVEKQ